MAPAEALRMLLITKKFIFLNKSENQRKITIKGTKLMQNT